MRPIFDEPPSDLDATWTHGALVGGMIGFEQSEIAWSYFRAANAVASQLVSAEDGSHALINPVLFLYRHGVELYLKAIVRPPELDHNLGSLLEAFCRHVRRRYGEPIPRWVTKPISEFARFDASSATFRYDDAVSPLRSEGEFWVDVRRLRAVMQQLEYALRRVLLADRTGEIPPAGCM